jgi:hypothetical protein
LTFFLRALSHLSFEEQAFFFGTTACFFFSLQARMVRYQLLGFFFSLAPGSGNCSSLPRNFFRGAT